MTAPTAMTDQTLSTYVNSLPPDAKGRYCSKLLYGSNTKTLPDPYVIKDWTDDPSTWPDLTFGDIYLYLIDTPSIYTKESMKAYKSLEAYRYVVSGHVQVVLSNAIADDCPFVVLKTKVTPSQRSRDKPHEPWVYLDKRNGAVYCAHCTCMAGLGEVCSHVAALLLKVEMAVKMGLTKTSSTSKACQWNSTFRKEVTPTTVTDIFQQIKGKRTKEIKAVQADGSAALPPKQVLDELYSIVPNAAFFTSINIPDLHQGLPASTIPVPRYPKLLSTLQQNDYNPEALDQICRDVHAGYQVTNEQANNLESATKNQSISPLWYKHRMGRVTASKAHDVFTLRVTTAPDNLLKCIIGYKTYDLSNKDSVKWGIDNEEECRQAYTFHQQNSHANFSCVLSGFVIDPDHPFLGASPDGIVNCECCGRGTLEVKCPYKHRDIPVDQAAATDKNFCLDANLTLKTTHRYYTQIQMQMFVTKCQYADFVVYNKCQPVASMVIVRVSIDHEFCVRLIEKCDNFVKTCVIRELVTRQLENEPVPMKNIGNSANTEKTWCICSEPEYGRMIQCDSDQCPYEWFHYRCVNIRRKPIGPWFCTSCDK